MSYFVTIFKYAIKNSNFILASHDKKPLFSVQRILVQASNASKNSSLFRREYHEARRGLCYTIAAQLNIPAC